MAFKNNILITGVTGNLGSQILKLILLTYKKEKKINIFLLVRAENKIQAKRRLIGLLNWLFGRNYKDFLRPNIVVLVGDLTNKKFGLSDKDYFFLIQTIDVIYHSAALTHFHDPISNLRLVNVVGTERILDFVSCSKKLAELNYISTAFIVGNFEGRFEERDFNVGQNFNNPYEQSKFEAEGKVRKFSKNWEKVRIFRPSIVVGEYQTGAIFDFQMFYKPLYLLAKEAFEEIPIDKSTLLNLIPVDVAARMIFTLANDPIYDNNSVYHIVSPNAFNIVKIIDLASEYFHFDKPKLFRRTVFQNPAFGRLYKESIRPFLNYFTFKAKFGCQKTIDRLEKLNFFPPSIDEKFLKRIFAYAMKRKYLRINN